MVRTVLLGIVAALALAAAPTSAEADDCGCGYGGYGGYYGYWNTPFAYNQGSAYVPPYYAIHPPVYYSPQIIARPYGTSPYAWPATYMPPAPPAKPMVIMNAHVKNADSRVAEAKPQMIEGVQPEQINNPYFVSK